MFPFAVSRNPEPIGLPPPTGTADRLLLDAVPLMRVSPHPLLGMVKRSSSRNAKTYAADCSATSSHCAPLAKTPGMAGIADPHTPCWPAAGSAASAWACGCDLGAVVASGSAQRRSYEADHLADGETHVGSAEPRPCGVAAATSFSQ